MSERENLISVETGHALYQEGADYMKFRTLKLLEAELARHRKGSSGHAIVEMLKSQVLELQSVT
jgi:hypothetical protein